MNMNISTEERAYLLRSYWNIRVASPQFPNGEISGNLSKNVEYINPPSEGTLKPISWKTWVTLVILVFMFVFLITEVVQPHLTLFATCVLLNVLGIITMEHIQHGYSAEEPLQKTNLLNFLARYMFGGGTWVRLNMLRMMFFMTILSTFLANAPMTALFTPIILEWCRMTDLPQSKFLMPMLFAIIMGGMNSLIGSSTNILVEGLLRTYGIPSLGFLEVSLVSVPCLLLCFSYMMDVEKTKGRKHLTKITVHKNSRLISYNFIQVQKKWNLFRLTLVDIEGAKPVPVNKTEETPLKEKKTEEIIVPTVVPSTPEPDLAQEAKSEEPTFDKLDERLGPLEDKKDVKIDVQTDEVAKDLRTIQEGDILHIVGDIYVLKKLLMIGGILAGNSSTDPVDLVENIPNPDAFKHEELIIVDETPKNKYWEYIKIGYRYMFTEQKAKKKPLEYYQALLSPHNEAIGTSIFGRTFLECYGALVLGISKQDLQESDVKFQDVLYDQCDLIFFAAKDDFYRKWIYKKDFLFIQKFQHQEEEPNQERLVTVFKKTYAIWWWDYIAYPIFFAMILVATLSNNLGWGFPMIRVGLIVLTLFVCLGILTFDGVLKSISLKLVVLIASSLTIGNAILESGLASAFGQGILAAQIPVILIPSIILLFAMITTQFVHNNATAAIFFPLALGVSETLGISMRPLAIAVLIGANCSFATPIGYECNMMIQGPGKYKFKDYVIYGTPVCLIYWIACSIMIPLIWVL